MVFWGGRMSRRGTRAGGKLLSLSSYSTDPGQSTGAVGQFQADDAGDDQAD